MSGSFCTNRGKALGEGVLTRANLAGERVVQEYEGTMIMTKVSGVGSLHNASFRGCPGLDAKSGVKWVIHKRGDKPGAESESPRRTFTVPWYSRSGASWLVVHGPGLGYPQCGVHNTRVLVGKLSARYLQS